MNGEMGIIFIILYLEVAYLGPWKNVYDCAFSQRFRIILKNVIYYFEKALS